MSLVSPLLRRRAFRVALGTGLAGLTALGTTLAGAGTASAASQWRLTVVNASIPSGSGSLKITFDSGSFSCQRVDLSSGSATVTNANIFGGQGFSIKPYGDTQCSGSTTGGGIGYRIEANDDRSYSGGLDCRNIRLRIDRSDVAFTNCGV